MTLTKRQRQLLKQLLNAPTVTTVAALAASVTVSVRTLRYDLKAIREWLDPQPVTLESQPHKGVWLAGTPEDLQQLREALDSSTTDALAPSIRMVNLVLILAQSADYQTLQLLQTKIQVSQTTLKHDIKKLRAYLEHTGVALVAKNYYGFQLGGAEPDIRRLLTQLLTAGLSRESIPASISHSLDTKHMPAHELPLTGDSVVNHLFNTVFGFAVTLARHGMTPPPTGQVIDLLVRLTVSLMRQSINKPLNSYQEADPAELPAAFSSALVVKAAQYHHVPLLRDDYQYVIGAKPPKRRDQNLVAATRAIIAEVSGELGTDFTSDSQLQENLYLHLSQQDAHAQALLEYSPFTQDLQQNYPQLFGAVRRVASRVLAAGEQPVSDAFVSYIVLHFLVSMQRRGSLRQNVRIAYVCATGLGITNLIQQRLAATVSNIELVGFASLDNANALIAREHPDLVVSIFPLKDVAAPVIEVQPLPTPSDIERIRLAVSQRLAVPAEQLMPHRQAANPVEASLAGQTQETILKMFAVYGDLKAVLPQPIAPAYADAFLMHVFLATHRVMFDQQYQDADTSGDDPKLARPIQQVFTSHDLAINRAEVHAIIEYLNLTNQTKGGGAVEH